MLLNKATQFDITPYRFNIKSAQIEKKNQALVETKVSKKDEKGEYQVLYNPSLVVNFKKNRPNSKKKTAT